MNHFFASFQLLIQGPLAKPASTIPESVIDKGYFDAFYLEIFGKDASAVQLGRPERRRQVFANIVSDSYDFLSSQSRPKKCSNNYFLTGRESEDLLEMFRVLFFDRIKYARVPNRPVLDFYTNALLKFDSVEKYQLVLDASEQAQDEPVLENQSFMSLANNPSFVCLDEVGRDQSQEIRQVEVFFVAGNDGVYKANFMKEIENIFQGNSR